MLISYYEKHVPDLVSLLGLFLQPETWPLGCTAIQFCSDVEGETRGSSHLLQISHCHSLQSRSDICRWHPQPTSPLACNRQRGKHSFVICSRRDREPDLNELGTCYHSDHKQGTSVSHLVLTVWLRWPQNPHFFLEPQSLNVWFLLIVALGVGIHCVQ